MPQLAALISQLLPRQQELRQPATAATLLNLTIYRCLEGALACNQPSKFTYFEMQGLLGCCTLAVLCWLCQVEGCQVPPDEGLACKCCVSWESLAPHQDPARDFTGVRESIMGFPHSAAALCPWRGLVLSIGLVGKIPSLQLGKELTPPLAFTPKAFHLAIFFHVYYNGLCLLLLLDKNVNQQQ